MEQSPKFVLTATSATILGKRSSTDIDSSIPNKRIKISGSYQGNVIPKATESEEIKLKNAIKVDPSAVTLLMPSPKCFSDMIFTDMEPFYTDVSTSVLLKACAKTSVDIPCSPVVIKIVGVVPLTLDEDEDALSGAHAEAVVLQFLNKEILQTGLSPHIVPLYMTRMCSILAVRKWLSQIVDAKEKLEDFKPEEDDVKECIVMVTEKLNGDLAEYLKKREKDGLDAFNEDDLAAVIFQTMYTLAQIQHLDPTFRHNDLHPGNVLIFKERFITPNTYNVADMSFSFPENTINSAIWDFGYSGSQSIRNGRVLGDGNLIGDMGIFHDDSDPDVINKNVYDSHFFMHQLWQKSDYHEPYPYTQKELDFLNWAIPPQVNWTNKDNNVDGFRLTAGAQEDEEVRQYLRTPAEILRHSYFDRYRVDSMNI